MTAVSDKKSSMRRQVLEAQRARRLGAAKVTQSAAPADQDMAIATAAGIGYQRILKVRNFLAKSEAEQEEILKAMREQQGKFAVDSFKKAVDHRKDFLERFAD
ncbi:hypothetical protein JCM17846_24100 [Iodidimonas nitroreducens]|uniref:Uncharacterized protein n=1 Tax=Iodidimonas nitroreducens TaxID=1236968 RepID=A0A5A7N9F6_9PROT|nr:hypothetical protein [Iodidimonas nitroreducens]GAK34272.1 hypothetical protein AQ1_02170 [alpha proteobacterium Q-1]GER04728.1 hypothetical protein JCM17846_24100 [Iodidimonas nitroreducens]